MLFDLRGRRKRFIQVIYATLAVLMGGGLVFFGIGSDVSGGLFERSSTRQRTPPASRSPTRPTRSSRSSPRTRQNEDLLVALVRARYSAGNNLSEHRPEHRRAGDHPGGRAGVREGRRRLGPLPRGRRGAEPERRARSPPTPSTRSADGATTAEQQSVELRVRGAGAEDRRRGAARAPGHSRTLAFYSYAALDFKGGDKAAKQAVKAAPNKGAGEGDREAARLDPQAGQGLREAAEEGAAGAGRDRRPGGRWRTRSAASAGPAAASPRPPSGRPPALRAPGARSYTCARGLGAIRGRRFARAVSSAGRAGDS